MPRDSKKHPMVVAGSYELSWQETALIALEQSIKHWERMAEQPLSPKSYDEPSAYQCECCNKFGWPASEKRRIASDEVCMYCPIYLHTREVYCKETPYTKADILYDNWEMGRLEDNLTSAREEFVEIAEAEIALLKHVQELVKLGNLKPGSDQKIP